jgi:hypothetical protein
MAVLAVVGYSIIPVLFSMTEARLFQQTVASVEQNGQQMLQDIGSAVRGSERILGPLPLASGSVLALQKTSGMINPVIIGVSSGSFVLVEKTLHQVLSSPEVTIDHFVVRNTSQGLGQSVRVSFTISRLVKLQAPRRYSRDFEGVFTVFPRDVIRNDGCALPGCGPTGTYTWQVLDAGTCKNAQTLLDCHP